MDRARECHLSLRDYAARLRREQRAHERVTRERRVGSVSAQGAWPRPPPRPAGPRRSRAKRQKNSGFVGEWFVRWRRACGASTAWWCSGSPSRLGGAWPFARAEIATGSGRSRGSSSRGRAARRARRARRASWCRRSPSASARAVTGDARSRGGARVGDGHDSAAVAVRGGRARRVVAGARGGRDALARGASRRGVRRRRVGRARHALRRAGGRGARRRRGGRGRTRAAEPPLERERPAAARRAAGTCGAGDRRGDYVVRRARGVLAAIDRARWACARADSRDVRRPTWRRWRARWSSASRISRRRTTQRSRERARAPPRRVGMHLVVAVLGAVVCSARSSCASSASRGA